MAERLEVISGFIMAKRGFKMLSVRKLSLTAPSVLVITQLPEPSLPEPGIVSITPTGKASSTCALPEKKSQKSPL